MFLLDQANKENTQPTHGGKTVIKRDKTSAAPFQLKRNEKEDTLFKKGPLKGSAKKEPAKTVGMEQKDAKEEKRVAVPDVKQKSVTEAPKPPAALPPTKPAPGMYKGKIVQSKIGSIWKSSATVSGADSKPSRPQIGSQKVETVTKSRTKSASDLPERGKQKPASARPNSVFSKPPQPSKPTGRPPAGFYSARPPARTVPATLACTNPRGTAVAPTKAGGTQNARPKSTVTDKVSKPPVSSTLSQYRLNGMETAEEKRYDFLF